MVTLRFIFNMVKRCFETKEDISMQCFTSYYFNLNYKTLISNGALMLFLCLFGYGSLQAQHLMKKVPLKEQITNSSLVVEGEVVAKASVWDDNHSKIYTVNTLKVYKVFKGNLVKDIYVVTQGGVVGLEAMKVFPCLNLTIGDIGVFTLRKSDVTFTEQPQSYSNLFKPYASAQSLFKYDLEHDKVFNTYNTNSGIEKTLYTAITEITKKPYVAIVPFSVFAESSLKKQSSKNSLASLPPSNITFLPTHISGGTRSVLTITGTGFGATKGKVGFANADDGGASMVNALDSQVLTWNNTRITVEVPSNVSFSEAKTAGSGKIRITNANRSSGESLNDLIITFSELNVPSNITGTLIAYPVQHVDTNSYGGITFEMFTPFFYDTEVTGARAAFERSFNKWICTTGINWTISNTATSIDKVESDDVNIIRFDNGNELGAGVLGSCISYFSRCNTEDNVFWYVSEIDITFNNATNWYTGMGVPASNQIDFESVSLHELGHGHQLQHVIDRTVNGNNLDDVMHFAASYGTFQRVLNSNNIAGANNVQSRSTRSTVCNKSIMTGVSCDSLSLENVELNKAISIFPNPTSRKFSIEKNLSSINLDKLEVYDINGRLVFKDNFSSSRIKTVEIKNASSGLYLVKIYSESGTVVKKVLIK